MRKDLEILSKISLIMDTKSKVRKLGCPGPTSVTNYVTVANLNQNL